MKWVKDFYTKQYDWMDLNDEEMLRAENERLHHLESFSDKAVQSILELGGGKGYFAVAAALKGYEVTVIELTGNGVAHIHKLAKQCHVAEKITVIQGDFYQADLPDQFDIVCYWDSFGIGTDTDQQRLLKRIRQWLKSGGAAFIDIYTPWFWAGAAGQSMTFGNGVQRAYDFDAENCRMLDSWWEKDQDHVTQSLRCYSPADLKLLLSGTNLESIHFESGGAMDYDAGQYIEKAPLHKAMSYLAVIK
ncbi:N-methyl-transferase-related protein [Jeotgalibacillus malaysiensis]|uniref:N-methyl-transferase-related protein n=1 Tax=Jeotgalibacillus malaysiensis TaxID=1508404 RepID=A0A0B5ARN3_9BACL|nr:class I SAM-dependent methyltransferase [Jeotgalibacillus malaysiensis]AJD92920.1 N-methyl-transferase-related protein [Jeotgalibacillus malaysiensis]